MLKNNYPTLKSPMHVESDYLDLDKDEIKEEDNNIDIDI